MKEKASNPMSNIDYYYSVLSPFAYLAGLRLEEIAERNGAEVSYKPFDIMAVFSRTGGTAPGDRHESRKSYRLQDLGRSAKFLGMEINLAPAHWPTNPVPASCAIISASVEGGGDLGALTHSVLRACWAEEKDIADAGVIAECLGSAGFPAEVASMGAQSTEAAYRGNTEDAVRSNVFGSPAYVVGDQVFWGQDRLEHLEAWLSGKLD